MKISQALLETKSKLKNHSPSYLIDSLILICNVTNLTKEEVIFDDKSEITSDQLSQLEKFILRRQNKEPISHIINHREFFNLDFYVDKNVLDPRPDSEILVESAINEIQKNANLAEFNFLEIGVGSGCLSISILKNIADIKSCGVDISEEAIKICLKNIAKHNLNNRITIKKSDLFKDLQPQKFDLIISNPPYIKKDDIDNLEDEVKFYEPKLALDGGEDGLEFYRKIAKNSKNYLKSCAKIILEIGYDQKNEVINIFESEKFQFINCQKDLANRDRVLIFKN